MTQERTDKGKFRDGTIKVVADMNSEERYIARSFKFRKKLKVWMSKSVGESWATNSEMARDAANYVGCAMQTASRWLYQYTGPGQEYELREDEDGDRMTLVLRKPVTIPTWDEEKKKEKAKT